MLDRNTEWTVIEHYEAGNTIHAPFDNRKQAEEFARRLAVRGSATTIAKVKVDEG